MISVSRVWCRCFSDVKCSRRVTVMQTWGKMTFSESEPTRKSEELKSSVIWFCDMWSMKTPGYDENLNVHIRAPPTSGSRWPPLAPFDQMAAVLTISWVWVLIIWDGRPCDRCEVCISQPCSADMLWLALWFHLTESRLDRAPHSVCFINPGGGWRIPQPTEQHVI